VSPDTRVRVIANISLHVFQWQPFTLIRILYEYDLDSYEMFLRESRFRKPVRVSVYSVTYFCST